jgi:hypothetical protein
MPLAEGTIVGPTTDEVEGLELVDELEAVVELTSGKTAVLW